MTQKLLMKYINSKDSNYRKIYFKMTKDYLYFPNINKFLKDF